MYKNGFEFWRDLVAQFGKVEAVRVANDYLDIRNDWNDREEYRFKCELYRAMQAERA